MDEQKTARKPKGISLAVKVGETRPEGVTPRSIIVEVEGSGGVYACEYAGPGEAQAKKAENKARRRVEAKIGEILREHDANERDNARTLIACGNGTMLLVQRGQYSIARKPAEGEERSPSLCYSPTRSHAEMLDDARKHAHGSYDGILWECRV